MSQTLDDYLALITSWHRHSPRFVATVAATLKPFSDVQAALEGLVTAFDLDVAIGAQLDVLGRLVGVGRLIPIPVRGLYFALDDTDRGFDAGFWRGPYDTNASEFRLDDGTYRRLIRAKIAANASTGTVRSAQAALTAYFAGQPSQAYVEDRAQAEVPLVVFAFDRPGRGFDESVWEPRFFAFDDADRGFDETRWVLPFIDDDPTALSLSMGMSITVIGDVPPATDLSILQQRLIPVKPQGVELDVLVPSVSGEPLFAFDISSDFFAGFDRSALAVTPNYLLTSA